MLDPDGQVAQLSVAWSRSGAWDQASPSPSRAEEHPAGLPTALRDLLGPCSSHHLLVPAGEAAGERALTMLQGSPQLRSGSWWGWSWEEGSGKLLWGQDVVGRVEKASGASR